jgi:hypothetical protein
MSIQQTLQNEIEDSKRWLDREKVDSTYKRDLQKRIELINWVLEKMNSSDIPICDTIESRMNETILKINQTHDILEADELHSDLRILDWILYNVCSNEIDLEIKNKGLMMIYWIEILTIYREEKRTLRKDIVGVL